MSNSKLVNYTKISQNKGIFDDQGMYCMDRNNSINKITIHHMAGNYTLEQIGNSFCNPARGASANYAIDSNGKIGLYVEEEYRAWTSGDVINDGQAITIEVANISSEPNWEVSAASWNSLIKLCADICQRNGIEKLVYTGDSSGNLTTHKMFQATVCPGPYLSNRMGLLAEKVNDILYGKEFIEDVEKSVTEYTVKAGDSLWVIAQNLLGNGNRYEEIKKFNNLDSNFIYAGMVLKIPIDSNKEYIKPTNPYKEPTTDLKTYITGEGVKWIQWQLNEIGYTLEIDGSFGPDTTNKIKQFQKDRGLEVNGIVTTTVRDYLKNPDKKVIKKPNNPYYKPNRALTLWDVGESVKWLQWELKQQGYTLEIDGSFGPATDAAVRDYQKRMGLEVDGSVGPATQNSLLND